MNCKNCGTPILPGALRCPTCNIEYSKSDQLVISDFPSETLIEPILPEEEVTLGNIKIEDQEIKENKFDPNIIVPIEMPKPTEVTIPVVNEIHDEIKVENITQEKKTGLLPEERGSNKLFIVFGIILLISGLGFYIYTTFINPSFVDEIVYFFNPSQRPIEEEQEEIDKFEKTVLNYEELEQYMDINASYERLDELLSYTYKSLKTITEYEGYYEILAYKETNENLTLIEEGKIEIEKILKKYDINDTFEINVFQEDDIIRIIFECTTVVATSEE